MTDDPTTVGGRYELGDTLGRGGMAEVRHAVDRRLGRPVAVKQLRADLAVDPTFQARFRREAQSAAGLNHPTIVAVYDTGEEADPISGVSIPYIVMELVEGPTLRDVIRDGRKILPERALELTQGVLDALSYSHKAGIIHRDIKPANVMLTPTGGVKVMDFGIARAVADTSATMTQTAAVIGTAQYLSPEQARGETVDSRSDIYSAGCLLYELLVGRPPFIGESPVSVAYQHVREIPVPPSQLDPVVTPDIDAVTLKALAKDPDDRYQSAREMKADISRVLAGQQATAIVPKVMPADALPTQIVAAPAAIPMSVVETEDFEEEDEERKSRVGLGIFITGLILLLLGAGTYGLFRMMQPDTPPPPGQVKVPAVLTYTEQQAKALIQAEQLKVISVTDNGDVKTKGQVTSQDPKGGAMVDEQSTVTITVNVGPKTAKIPDGLVGKDLDDVQDALKKAKFTNVFPQKATTEDADAKANEVLSVLPKEGSSAALDETITVTYATGESLVPDLTGRLQSRAEDDAKAAGFKTKVVEEESDEPAGIVLRQDPPAGTSLKRDKTITLTVATAKAEAPPPPVVPPTTTTSPDPTEKPTDKPTDQPTDEPTDKPTDEPTSTPTSTPSSTRTPTPTSTPTSTRTPTRTPAPTPTGTQTPTPTSTSTPE